jgi:hypothetical protein
MTEKTNAIAASPVPPAPTPRETAVANLADKLSWPRFTAQHFVEKLADYEVAAINTVALKNPYDESLKAWLTDRADILHVLAKKAADEAEALAAAATVPAPAETPEPPAA